MVLRIDKRRCIVKSVYYDSRGPVMTNPRAADLLGDVKRLFTVTLHFCLV